MLRSIDSRPLILPDDESNRTLVSHVHPRDWINPKPSDRYNLVVIGGGTAGLVTAAGGAGLGARVALVERHLLGGDCLNVGCVPSKGLIGSARVAARARDAGRFGVRVTGVEVDFPAVMERMRRLRAGIAPNDGAARFESLGVDVFIGEGRFSGPSTITVEGETLEFSRAVIAAGARAAAPPIEGLEEVGYLTNETVFELTDLPRRLAVVGAGPIGCELAQAFRRFGSEVTLIEAADRILVREDADAAAIVEERMHAEGVRLALGAMIDRAELDGNEKLLRCRNRDGAHAVACDEILVGVGRAPNVEDLGLETAGIEHDGDGVTVNDRLQTTNPRVYAAGDVCSRLKFTHAADFQARLILQNALFAGRKKVSALNVPWCTYTDPEIAHVGLYEREASARGIGVDTITVELGDVDRAVLDGEDRGFVRVHLRKGSDRILGATIVAAHAGDMISEITVAMTGRIGLGTLANAIHPYPTQAEAIRKAGDAYNRTRLTPWVKKLFERWLAFRR